VPWVAVYIPTYLVRGNLTATAPFSSVDFSDVSFFSTARLFAGDSVVSYTAIASLGAFVAALALVAFKSSGGEKEKKRRFGGLFAGAAAGVACFLTLILYFSLLTGYQVCVRYSVPFLLGTCVIAGLLAPSLNVRLPRFACAVAPAAVFLAIFVSFVPAASGRFEQAKQYGSILEFADATKAAGYLPYIQVSLSDAARQQILQLQADVPPGEPILAWIDTPYFLNYRRNPIVDVDTAGTATHWAHIPPDVHYFLWQYAGFAVGSAGDYQFRIHEPRIGMRDRMIAARSFELANRVTVMANHAQVVAQLSTPNDRYVLFRVGGTPAN
jgi:hypothetical protein